MMNFLKTLRLLLFLILFFHVLNQPVYARVYEAETGYKIREVLSLLKPGDTLEIEPGTYKGGILIHGLNGKKGLPVTIKGKDSSNPPIFIGGKTALNFSQCNYICLADVIVRRAGNNGIHVHDGNTGKGNPPPSVGIVLKGIIVEDIGPVGNFDAIKMSGVNSFVIKQNKISGWGGSGIDCVGCANGKISQCLFQGKRGFSQANGVQIKGGSHNILVEKCYFYHPGRRGINLGGSTGFKWFRPGVTDYEAKKIEVAGNIFIGGTAIAFVTSQQGYVHHNAILYPTGWVLRILQEDMDPRFKPCGNSLFMKNIIVVNEKMKDFINIGPGTFPQSFRFRANVWYDPALGRIPRLPFMENAPVYQVNPGVKFEKGKVFFLGNDPRLAGKGPNWYKHKK
ncbi:hypothetical protein DO021_11540 [Desulfobacter hydrogenophilus]|nr:right-handed parallel beta-helix repeat-containing protein [Desulfobacter hydrogenophilus]RAM01894.1 hypothetical protein DO021_11540 [Desulfobacter hydrogenophilus]